MKFRASLRNRVTLAFALVGTLVSAFLVSTLYLLSIDMEERLVEETLSAELQYFISRFQADPDTPPPVSTLIQTFVIPSNNRGHPKEIENLENGLHRIKINGKEFFADVSIQNSTRFIMLYDEKQIHHRKVQFRLFLALGVLMLTFITAFLGYWLAGRVISPVSVLAGRVASLRPEDTGNPLATEFSEDEVGALALEFDNYRKRLIAFIEREQAFTADVSHELRTPLAVIEGASEVLLDDPSLTTSQRDRVKRISRSVVEMSELVAALLMLAREEGGQAYAGECSVQKVLTQVIDSHQYLVAHKSVTTEEVILHPLVLSVECVLLRVVIANLIRNAFMYTKQGKIIVQLDDSGISVRDTGVGISEKQINQIFDRFYSGSESDGSGIGLSLVKRICLLYKWKIEIESEKGQGTTFRLLFSPEATLVKS